jgi:hypothetical protein
LIAFIVGATTEPVKIAPVFHELTSRGRATEIWYSGQPVDRFHPSRVIANTTEGLGA